MTNLKVNADNALGKNTSSLSIDNSSRSTEHRNMYSKVKGVNAAESQIEQQAASEHRNEPQPSQNEPIQPKKSLAKPKNHVATSEQQHEPERMEQGNDTISVGTSFSRGTAAAVQALNNRMDHLTNMLTSMSNAINQRADVQPLQANPVVNVNVGMEQNQQANPNLVGDQQEIELTDKRMYEGGLFDTFHTSVQSMAEVSITRFVWLVMGYGFRHVLLNKIANEDVRLMMYILIVVVVLMWCLTSPTEAWIRDCHRLPYVYNLWFIEFLLIGYNIYVVWQNHNSEKTVDVKEYNMFWKIQVPQYFPMIGGMVFWQLFQSIAMGMYTKRESIADLETKQQIKELVNKYEYITTDLRGTITRNNEVIQNYANQVPELIQTADGIEQEKQAALKKVDELNARLQAQINKNLTLHHMLNKKDEAFQAFISTKRDYQAIYTQQTHLIGIIQHQQVTLKREGAFESAKEIEKLLVVLLSKLPAEWRQAYHHVRNDLDYGEGGAFEEAVLAQIEANRVQAAADRPDQPDRDPHPPQNEL